MIWPEMNKEEAEKILKLNGKWPANTYLQKRLKKVRNDPLYQNLYPDVKKEGDNYGRK